MSELSKLRTNENNFDITFYLIYLQLLYENILKHSRLNFFKVIAIGFHHGLHMTSKSPARFLYNLLV